MTHPAAVDAGDPNAPPQRHRDAKLATAVAVEVEAVVRRVVAGDERQRGDLVARIDVEELPRIRLPRDRRRCERDREH